MDLKLIGILAAVVVGSKLILNRYTPDEEVKEAHVEPARQAALARNWGSIERVSTERNIMAGRALGQTIDYNTPVGQENADAVNENWTAYSYTLMTTEPTFAQNYFGRAIGSQ